MRAFSLPLCMDCALKAQGKPAQGERSVALGAAQQPVAPCKGAGKGERIEHERFPVPLQGTALSHAYPQGAALGWFTQPLRGERNATNETETGLMEWRPKRATAVPFLNLLEFLSSRFSSPSIRFYIQR